MCLRGECDTSLLITTSGIECRRNYTLAVLVANLLPRPRIPPSNVTGGLFDWRGFKNPAFSCCVLAYHVSWLGLYVPLIYLDLSGQEPGYSPDFPSYLISIANCAFLIGRFPPGILADKIWGPEYPHLVHTSRRYRLFRLSIRDF
ncbi:hypothetical protein BKA83DRAFT_4298286 [Pisolithus microcarpus]|nr:hypothetical protein BKA83DRAFT_4298286 [Pisolithus microcarpus]